MQTLLVACLGLATIAGADGFSLGGFAAPLNLAPSSSAASRATLAPGLRPASLGRARLQQRGTAALRAQVYNNDDDKPKAQKELLQVRFATSDPKALSAWIQKWPAGGKKDNFGLPKLMLPVSTEKRGDGGLKIIFKGSLDPWLQIELEGDTVRVYRCSGLATTSLQVSALKEREEGKICDKLKADLAAFGEMKEKEIPVVEPKRDEPEETADVETPAPTPTEAKAEDGGDKPPPTPA